VRRGNDRSYCGLPDTGPQRRSAKHKHVDIPASRVKAEISKILLSAGFLESVKFIEDGRQGILRVYLRYTKSNDSVISGVKRISKPSRADLYAQEETAAGVGWLRYGNRVDVSRDAVRRGMPQTRSRRRDYLRDLVASDRNIPVSERTE